MKRLTKLGGVATVGVLALGILSLTGTTAQACFGMYKKVETYKSVTTCSPNATSNGIINTNGNNNNNGNRRLTPPVINNNGNGNGNGNGRNRN